MEIKKCIKCGKELPFTEEYFCKHKKMKTGLLNMCKECRKVINKEYKEKNKEKLKEKRKIYYQNRTEQFKSKSIKTTEEFKAKVFDLVGDEYQVVGEYINATTRVEMLHIKCSNKYKVLPHNFFSGNRCPFCSPSPRKVAVGINSMWDTNPELAKLLLNPEDGYKYTQFSHKKVDWQCPDCGEIIKNKGISHVNKEGLSCPQCGDGISYPNRLMFSILSNMNIDFETEKSFEWCQFIYKGKNYHGKYDFYFTYKNKEYVVEMDGYFHFNDNLMNGQTKEDSDYIDKQKDALARQHNIHPIRINSQKSELEHIKKEIIKSDLNHIFDLSSIDWDECERKSLTSLKIQACELWKEHHSTAIVSRIMKKSIGVIRNWLKLCTQSGLCDYESVFKCEVFCIDTNEYFNSATEASKKYNLDVSSISACCRGKRKSAGKHPDGTPLHWKYVNLKREYKKSER